jgi:hypothetical protein
MRKLCSLAGWANVSALAGECGEAARALHTRAFHGRATLRVQLADPE